MLISKQIEPAWALLVMMKAAKAAGIPFEMAQSIINQPLNKDIWDNLKQQD